MSISGSASSHPFLAAGPAQAAEEPVDHLDGAENHLQAGRGQKSSKQPDVELHDVLGLCACSPPGVVSQVTAVTAQKRICMEDQDFKET